jgi:hypothetical protein
MMVVTAWDLGNLTYTRDCPDSSLVDRCIYLGELKGVTRWGPHAVILRSSLSLG